MLHITLLILKIIGIILLCILGIILLAVVCALFVPLRYRIRVTREEGEGKPPVVVSVKFTWFLHLVNILIRYPSDVIFRVRIFVFTLFRLPKKNQRRKKPDLKKETDTGQTEESHISVAQSSGKSHSGSPQPADGSQESVTAGAEYVNRENEETDDREETANSSGTRQTLSNKIKAVIEKIKYILQKIKELFENIQYTIHNLCDKIKSTLDNIQYYRDVLTSEPFKQSFRLCKDELGYALRKLKPDKFDADLIIGMEDPAALGEIFALYGMLYPFIGQHIRIVGDFESGRTRIEGGLYVRGKVRAFTFLRMAIRIYLNKDVRKLIRLLKKEAV